MTSYIDPSFSSENADTTIMQEFLALVASTFDAHSVVLFQPSSESSHAHLLAHFSMSVSIDTSAVIAQGKGLVGWILRNKEPLLYNVAEYNQPNLGYYTDETEDYIRSFVGAPIPGGGALCMDSKKTHFFHENKQHLLHLFAKLIPQIQEIIKQSKRSGNVESYFRILEQLADLKKNYNGWSAYLSKLLRVLSVGCGFEYVAFATLSNKKNHYIVEGEYPPLLTDKEFPFSGGIVGWVFRNEEIVQSDGQGSVPTTPLFGKVDSFPAFCASICLPVRVEKNTVAVLTFASTVQTDLNSELKLLTRLISEDLSQFLEVVSLRYRVYKGRDKKNNSGIED